MFFCLVLSRTVSPLHEPCGARTAKPGNRLASMAQGRRVSRQSLEWKSNQNGRIMRTWKLRATQMNGNILTVMAPYSADRRGISAA